MRHSDNIFGPEYGRGPGLSISGVTIATLILTMLSIAAAIFLIANFDMVTAVIAMWVSEILSSIAAILIVGAVVLYFLLKRLRGFRRW